MEGSTTESLEGLQLHTVGRSPPPTHIEAYPGHSGPVRVSDGGPPLTEHSYLHLCRAGQGVMGEPVCPAQPLAFRRPSVFMQTLFLFMQIRCCYADPTLFMQIRPLFTQTLSLFTQFLPCLCRLCPCLPRPHSCLQKPWLFAESRLPGTAAGQRASLYWPGWPRPSQGPGSGCPGAAG